MTERHALSNVKSYLFTQELKASTWATGNIIKEQKQTKVRECAGQWKHGRLEMARQKHRTRRATDGEQRHIESGRDGCGQVRGQPGRGEWPQTDGGEERGRDPQTAGGQAHGSGEDAEMSGVGRITDSLGVKGLG